jgi:hypothetical protein
MTTRPSESDERFDAARVKRARADLEETVQGLRQSREPSAFAVKHAPQEVENVLAHQQREAGRIADERAGRPTKPFAEMDELEIFVAMASYAGPGHYPHDLEVIAQEMAERPVPTLSASDQEALGEVLSIRQRVEAGERDAWMVDQLLDLSRHATESVRVAAMGLRFQLVEEARSERDDQPEPDKR